MRGFVIAALAVIVPLSGCAQPQPPSPVAESAGEAPAALEQPIPLDSPASSAAAPIREAPQPAVVDSTPPASTASSTAAPTSEAPSAAAVQPALAATIADPVPADTGNRPTPTSPALPEANASAAQASETPADRSPVDVTAPEESTPPVAATTPAEPPAAAELDLAGLEQRLRETRAIGVFTKLSIKNQVDDLLDQFRGFYQGQLKVQLEELRERYELLLLKVLTLLQDADRELAQAITASREAIWGILTDPQKLATI